MHRRQGIWLGFGCAAVAGAIGLWLCWRGAGQRPAGPADAQPPAAQLPVAGPPLAGSTSCRECHEEFYRLWAPSHHGLAMQPFTPKLARTQLSAAGQEVRVGQASYRAQWSDEGGWVVERGPDGEKKYPMLHVLGGKNVFYFLTPLDRGRLQVLPIAYQVHERKWFDMPASAVRHVGNTKPRPVVAESFRDHRSRLSGPGEPSDAPLDWHNSALTFNTSCYDCHVSQLSRNYDPATKSYATVWAEPGINCETCHGPAAEHVRACRAAPPGQRPGDLKILSLKDFSASRLNDSCGPCHAKMSPISSGFQPGDRYFDHFDLVVLDHADFYPDGRDLGENYTFTSWRMSRCAQSGRLSCLGCHTSSGRYLFDQEPNKACTPCHEGKVRNLAAHSFHKADGPAGHCVACHMPATGFAAMRRTDHSMRPPAPAATLAFQSPNACNLCHADKEAAWADGFVRKWHKEDYQAPLLRWAGLVAAARRQDWTRLPEMAAEITRRDRDEVVAASLARLLGNCGDPRRAEPLLAAAEDAAPLVRAAAIEALGSLHAPEAAARLTAACSDDYRLVRVRAAAALPGFPAGMLDAAQRPKIVAAVQEYLASLAARPDQWTSHYGLGNYYLACGKAAEAAAAFEAAVELEPEAVPAYVNAAMAYAQLDRKEAAEKALRLALHWQPDSPPAHLNLGMLLAEEERWPEAEAAFRAALKHEPHLAAAAYNLSLLLARDRLAEALGWARTAYQDDPWAKYGYSLALLLRRAGRQAEALSTLRDTVRREPGMPEAHLLLGELWVERGAAAEALRVYRDALRLDGLPPAARVEFQKRIQQLESAPKSPLRAPPGTDAKHWSAWSGEG
jgi:tetratricopeptide (TPR) repeat protein